MTALTADVNRKERVGSDHEGPVAASTTIYKGSLIVRDTAGNLEPGATATGKVAAGVSKEYIANAGLAAAVNCKYRKGIFLFANSSGDPVSKANIEDTVFIEDDNTVSATNGGATQSAAGRMVDLDSDGMVHVAVGWDLVSLGLLAANNLSDVGTQATARSNLGLDTGDSPTFTGLTTSGAATLNSLGVTVNATVGGTLGITGATTLTGGVTGDVVASGKIDATNLYTDKVTISNAEVKDLVANPKELVAAQGANKVIEFVSAAFRLNYAGAQFTESADNLQIAYVDGSGKKVAPEYETTGSFLVAAAEAFGFVTASDQFLTASVAEAENVALVLYNTSGDFGGGGTSTVDVWVTYRVHNVA